MRIQLNAITVARLDYAFFDYNTKTVYGESGAADKMPVMTYAGFGSEIRKNVGKFHWLDYDYIICDEMQNLVGYQEFATNRDNLVAAEVAIRTIAVEKKAIVVAISATPQKIRENFGELCHDVPFDRTNLIRLRTFSEIPYSCPIKKLLDENKGKTGILYTAEIGDMKKYIKYANSIGMRANGFWSPSVERQKKEPHTQQQWDLRKEVLWNETIPAYIDLLVINRASETCIKINQENRKVDFMIVHDKKWEIRTQVRGRYHGDLDTFYYHNVDESNKKALSAVYVPESYLNRRLYKEDQDELCDWINYRKGNGKLYKMPTVIKLLRENGYDVSESKQDSSNGGKRYRVITKKLYHFEHSLIGKSKNGIKTVNSTI